MPGSAPVQVAVVGVILRGRRVLSLRRAQTNLAGPGLWETVSGRVERAEHPLDAIQREVREESQLGVEIDPRPVRSYGAPIRGWTVVVVYRAVYRSGEVVLSSEHDAYAWLTCAELAQRSSLPVLLSAVRTAMSLSPL